MLHRSFTCWPYLTEFQKSQNWGLRHGRTSRIFLSCAKAQPSAAMQSLGCRLMAGQRILVPSMGVRLPPSQPLHLLHMARSSSGLGRRPLKAEITSSNLVRATKILKANFSVGFFFSPKSAPHKLCHEDPRESRRGPDICPSPLLPMKRRAMALPAAMQRSRLPRCGRVPAPSRASP